MLALAIAALPLAAVGQERPTVPSTSQPSSGDRLRSDTAETRQETTVEARPPDRAPSTDPRALVLTDEDTESGRCRVISKRRLFGGIFMHRKCDDRAPSVGG